MYCLLYTVVLKRRTSLSILVASLASACIPAAGRIAAVNSINGEGMLFILVTFMWGILYFTGIATVYSRDHMCVRIPAFPVSLSEKSAGLLLNGTITTNYNNIIIIIL